MEAGTLSVILRATAEYGILALGWILFFFAMLYIRVERARYQDLVIHIITYFTKIHMLRTEEDDLSVFPPDLFPGGKGTNRSASRRNRSRINSQDDAG